MLELVEVTEKSFQHRAIRDGRNGHHGFEPSTAAGHHRAVEAGGLDPAGSGHASRGRHRQVRDGARSRGLPAGGIFQPEGEPLPGEELLPDSVRGWMAERKEREECDDILPPSRRRKKNLEMVLE